MTGAPQGNGRALIENPADREREKRLAEALPSERLQRVCRSQILTEARLLELRVDLAQVVAVKLVVGSYLARQQAAAQRAVA